MKTFTLHNKIVNSYNKIEDNLFTSDDKGYWSNLNVYENEKLINDLKKYSTQEIIAQNQNWLKEIIFSPKRAAGLELLNLKGNEICVDYGCMWGAITIPLSNICTEVLGIDQTLPSLRFLHKRIQEQKIDNIILLKANLNNNIDFVETFDVAVINGVLEWIPEEGNIELKNYFGKKKKKIYLNSLNPGVKQKIFLQKVYNNLKKDGKLYLAIENRYDMKCMLGYNDPHSNIKYTSIFPRIIADGYSVMKLKRKYVSWLYSFDELKILLESIGFREIEMYMAFPDYRFPEKIINYKRKLFESEISQLILSFEIQSVLKKILIFFYKKSIFKIVSPNFFAPSIIAVGKK